MIFNQSGKPLEMNIPGSPASINDLIQIVGHIRIGIPLKCPGKHFPNKISSEQQFILLQQFAGKPGSAAEAPRVRHQGYNSVSESTASAPFQNTG
jgi:hypothetical protein